MMRFLRDLACWTFFTAAIAAVLPLVLLVVVINLFFDEEDLDGRNWDAGQQASL